MLDLVYCLTSLLFFDVPLFCSFINLKSWKTLCLSYGDIYLSSGICLSCPLITASESFCGEPLETFVTLLATLLPIKLPFASDFFWIAFFEAFLRTSVADSLA